MNCYNSLQYMEDCINNNGGFSYDKLDQLKEKNELRKMFEALNIIELLRYDFYSFLRIIESNNEYHEYLNKIYANEAEFIKVFNRFGYVLSLYFGNKDAYRNFPLFFKECANYFNISKYSDMSLDDIYKLLENHLDLCKEYNQNANREITIVLGKIPQYYTTYSKYDTKLNNINEVINCNNIEEFFVYSEYEAYQRELHALSNYNLSNPKEYIKWVSRYHGDGYGYDVLSYDIKKNREKLIEVKSGKYDSFSLTPNEYKVMSSTINKQFVDYYIYRYVYDMNKNIIRFNVLKYDKRYRSLIDINTNDEYKIIPFYEEENGILKEYIDVLPQEKYIKTLK